MSVLFTGSHRFSDGSLLSRRDEPQQAADTVAVSGGEGVRLQAAARQANMTSQYGTLWDAVCVGQPSTGPVSANGRPFRTVTTSRIARTEVEFNRMFHVARYLNLVPEFSSLSDFIYSDCNLDSIHKEQR